MFCCRSLLCRLWLSFCVLFPFWPANSLPAIRQRLPGRLPQNAVRTLMSCLVPDSRTDRSLAPALLAAARRCCSCNINLFRSGATASNGSIEKNNAREFDPIGRIGRSIMRLRCRQEGKQQHLPTVGRSRCTEAAGGKLLPPRLP